LRRAIDYSMIRTGLSLTPSGWIGIRRSVERSSYRPHSGVICKAPRTFIMFWFPIISTCRPTTLRIIGYQNLYRLQPD
jgi:hypothetical protein